MQYIAVQSKTTPQHTHAHMKHYETYLPKELLLFVSFCRVRIRPYLLVVEFADLTIIVWAVGSNNLGRHGMKQTVHVCFSGHPLEQLCFFLDLRSYKDGLRVEITRK